MHKRNTGASITTKGASLIPQLARLEYNRFAVSEAQQNRMTSGGLFFFSAQILQEAIKRGLQF